MNSIGNNIRVKKYNVFLDIDLEKIIYKGYVISSINLLQKTNLIKINALDFVVKSIVINNISYCWRINNGDETIVITDNLGFTPLKI